jgi:hypothetical protein
MNDAEQKYLEGFEKVMVNLSTIQRKFVTDKTGIRAIIKFIEDFEGRRPFFELDDPVVKKGKILANSVVEEMAIQLNTLSNLRAPGKWQKFHKMMTDSIRTQIDGYKEMIQVFEDSEMDHIIKGKDKVNEGMQLLEMGHRN